MEAGEGSSLHDAIDDEMLAAGLGAAAIVDRGQLPAPTGVDCEIVTCRIADGSLRRLLCKFGLLEGGSDSTQHYGVAYEAQVYDELLPAWPDDVPRLHGAFLDDTTHTLVLALEYVEGGTSLDRTSPPKNGLLAAARWIARFHAWGETVAVPAFLRRYDTDFYRMWLARASSVTRGLHERHPWLPELCERTARRLPALLPAATIVHGEYQADNIIVHQGRSLATNWESAALAAGEIDLASLTWSWDGDLASLCEQQYCLVRWPDATPDDFALRLAAARLFLQLRWLGDCEDEGEVEALSPAIDELAPLAEKFAELDR